MMTQRICGRYLAALAAALTIFSGTSAVEAGFLAQLEGAQSTHGVSRQFKFEGATAVDRQNDSGGQHIDLLSAAGEGGSGANDVNATPGDTTDDVPWAYPAGDVNSIGYEAGYDGAGVSQAMRPQVTNITSTFAAEALAQRRSGAALYTNNFTSTEFMTFEAVVKPDKYVDSGNGPHYIFQTRPGTGRGYYMSQVPPTGSRGVGGSITPIIGNSIAERPAFLLDYVDPSNWYYLAITVDLSGGAAGFAKIDTYVANLTTGGPLTQTQNDYTYTNTIAATLLNTPGYAGIGMFVRPPGTTTLGQEFFFGAIDNLAIYHHALTGDQIAQHHRSLTIVGVPEPASFALLGLGAVLACGLRRRAS